MEKDKKSKTSAGIPSKPTEMLSYGDLVTSEDKADQLQRRQRWKKKRERDEFVAKGSRAGHRISAGDTVCATWEQDCRKRMLGDRQGQQLVGKKEDRVVYLKALFKYMIRARQTQKSEQTEVRTCSVCSCRTEFAVTVQKPQRCYLTGLVLFAGRRKWKWLVSMQKTETLLVKVLIISRKSPFGPGNPSFPMA